MSPTLVSIVAPVCDEEAVVERFFEAVQSVLRPLEASYDFEIVLVDDGSRDGSLALMKGLLRRDARLRVVELRRNYGQTHALQAGFDAARGDVVVTLDSDLQHFPDEIPAFLSKVEEGYDVVCGWRHRRAEGIVRRWPSRAANALIRMLSGLPIHDFGTTFRAYRAGLIRELRLLGDAHRYVPVLAHAAGARITEIPIKNVERPAGRSHYGLGRTLGVSLDLVWVYFLSRYMDRPLRAFGTMAAAAFGVGALILAVLLLVAWTSGIPTVREHSGWFLISVMLLLASVQILLTGILAEILVRVHYGQGDRRVYAIRRIWTADAP